MWRKKIERLLNGDSLSVSDYFLKLKKRINKPLIGYSPYACPPSLIYSLGAFPIGISSLPRAIKSDYFQSYMCSLFPEVVNKAIKSDLSFLDGLIIYSICDIARNSSTVIKELSHIRTHIAHYPIHLNKISKKFIKNEMKKIEVFIKGISSKNSSTSTEKLYSVNRKLISKLYEFRRKYPHKFLSSDIYALLSYGRICDVREHNYILKDFIKSSLSKSSYKKDNARVILTGFFCEDPPKELILAIEKSSCYIVDDDFFLDLREDEPYLATKSVGFSKNRMSGFIDRIKAVSADGVVVLSAEFCDHALMIASDIVEFLKTLGVPVLSSRYSRQGSFSSLQKEIIGTFSDTIRIWK